MISQQVDFRFIKLLQFHGELPEYWKMHRKRHQEQVTRPVTESYKRISHCHCAPVNYYVESLFN